MQRLPSELKYYCYYYVALECSVRFSRSFVGQRKGVRVHFGLGPSHLVIRPMIIIIVALLSSAGDEQQ